ncbi:putative HTH-type transcriptional regulator YraN [Pullulanibacillus camelliae]|uniref:Putative HTH-type transcriptional regulator YraN n=1 Tax=Pullulanibacillus camelliae TaxID=1707096 RepID=A0A8J2VM80_9BACL|nr:LysR family transcriptional regulator [Pullulanibacillus camelliae]GGE31706.1 putative HTH-type transcriptional regulator YraN [Pullulanibacillus camelliae]
MDNRDWVILQTIYETRNLTRAAESLFTSQPALSYRIKQLEKELNVQLIIKNNKALTFTPEGERLVAYAKQMTLEYQKVQDELYNMNRDKNGIIRLGVSSNYALYQLPSLLAEFNRRFPKIRFTVQTGWSSSVFQLMQNNESHIAITREEMHWTEQKEVISQDHYCIISKETIDLEHLPSKPRIFLKTNSTIVKKIEDWWKEHYHKPASITMEVDKLETCLEMVRRGLGFAIISDIGLTETDSLHKYQLHSLNGEPVINKTWLLYKTQTYAIPIIQHFIAYVRQYHHH